MVCEQLFTQMLSWQKICITNVAIPLSAGGITSNAVCVEYKKIRCHSIIFTSVMQLNEFVT